MPEELADAEGNVVWRARYATWGALVFENTKNAPEGFEQNLRMQGQYHDRETGLHYNTFRYYDPEVGRFISEDPIGLLGGDNLYQYAPNPLSWIDPWGWARCSREQGFGGRFKRWKPGDAIDKPLPSGKNPSWNTVKSRYWKNRAQSANSGEFDAANIERMRRGRAPLDSNGNPMELHHNIPQRTPTSTTNNPINLREVTREQHAKLDPYRRL